MEETEYNPRKTAMVINLSLVTEMAVTWTDPTQESNYQPNKFAMVYIHYLPAPATMDMIHLPIQENDYDPTKSLMVTTSPSLPTYMNTATVIMTP